MKKVVAFSTLSQLGFMFFCCVCVVPEMGMVYLLGHAFFKRLLFIGVGYLIFYSFHNQLAGNIVFGRGPIVEFLLFVRLFSILGGQFLLGFFLKHFLRNLLSEFGILF